MRKLHYGNVDKDGNYRDKGRKSDGYLKGINNDLPFPAIVTAWHAKSQTIEVVRPTPNGSIYYDSIAVYGNFFEAAGTIQGPKIATTLKDDGFTTFRDDEQVDPTSDKYVLDNHIEAIVFPVSVGNKIAYAAQSFRFLTENSPLLNNVKEGRKITRHDDGSVYIHDDDGNFQYTHPSGLNIKVGSSIDDIELDEPFPPHEKNIADYDGEIIAEITAPSAEGDLVLLLDGQGKARFDHPSGTYSEYASDGKVKHYGADTMDFESVGDMSFKAPNINSEAATKFKVTSPTVEVIASTKVDMTTLELAVSGKLTIGGVIKAIGDIIADSAATAISLLTHFSQGNLGFPTGTPLQSGGGSTPSSPPVGESNGSITDGTGINSASHTHGGVEPGAGSTGSAQ